MDSTPNTYLTTGQSWTHTLTPRTDFYAGCKHCVVCGKRCFGHG